MKYDGIEISPAGTAAHARSARDLLSPSIRLRANPTFSHSTRQQRALVMQMQIPISLWRCAMRLWPRGRRERIQGRVPVPVCGRKGETRDACEFTPLSS